MVETLQDEKFKSTDFVVNLEIYKESHGFCIKLFLQKKFEKWEMKDFMKIFQGLL